MPVTKENIPFNPQFGKQPWSFVGRDELVKHLTDAFYDLNAPERSTIISGVRGSGKTALLSDISNELRKDKNWIILELSYSQDFLDNLLGLLAVNLEKSNFQLKEFGLSFGGASVSFERKIQGNFLANLLGTVRKLSEKGIGVVFSIDEIQIGEPLREFIADYQLLVREDLDVVLLMAGLPHFVLSVLTDDYITFLNRSNKIYLENIDPFDFKIAYERIFSKANRHFTEDALLRAYTSTGGYPYLYQLIGYHLWLSEKSTIDLPLVEEAIVDAKPKLYRNVYALAIKDLSPKERRYMLAIAQFSGNAKAAEIAEKMRATTTNLSKVRKSLIDRGLIKSPEYGYVAFTLPFMTDYLLEQEKQGEITL